MDKKITVAWDETDEIAVDIGGDVQASDLVNAAFLLNRVATRIIDTAEHVAAMNQPPPLEIARAMPRNGDN